MTFTRANALGWSDGQQLTALQTNHIDLNQSRAVDGTNGGTYTLAAPLTISGSTIDMVTVQTAALSQCYHAVLTASGLASGSKFTVTESYNNGGFSLASNEITVPAVGRWLVMADMHLTSTDVTNPRQMIVAVTVGTTDHFMQARRYSADATHTVGMSVHAVANITNTATQKILVTNQSGVAVSSALTGACNLTVRRIP